MAVEESLGVYNVANGEEGYYDMKKSFSRNSANMIL
jgi:hypothetical protein